MEENQDKDKEINEENQEIIENNAEQEPKEEIASTNPQQAEKIQEETEEANNEDIAKKSKKKEKKAKKPRKGSYILGTIGAILGGLVAALPWVLTYIFAENLVIPVLATLIPIGAFLGYKIFRGKVKKGFAPIITIVSILIIALLTTVICPTILMIQSSYEPTWENLRGLYSETREEIRTAIIEDLLIGLLFTIVGIVMISHFIRKQIRSLMGEEAIKAEHQEKKNILKEQTQAIKNACLNFNSLNKENAVKKKIIIKELVEIFNIKRKNAKLYFKNAKLNGLIKKHKGKYYYDENEEEQKLENFKKIKKRLFPVTKVLILILLIAIAVAGGMYIYSNMSRLHDVSDSGIKIKVDHNAQDFYGTEEEITAEFGEGISDYYDFILLDKNNKYEVYGLAIPNIKYEDKDFDTIMKEDRDYWAQIFGEEITVSDIETKQLGEQIVKEYNYDYISDTGKECRAIIYLYQGSLSYLWINVYTDRDVEVTQIDTVINNLLK